MIFFENNYPAYSDPVAGDYHKYMKPGTYTMRVTANGYETKEAGIVTVIAMQTTVKDVDLNPLSGQYAWRTTTARIPNFEPLNPGDEVYTAACLGPPDQVNYSIGKSGYVMVDMLTPVVNGDSTDITVYEGDDSPEGYSLYAGTTIDGPWQYLGFAYGTASFDLSLAGMNEARYFQVKDDNDGQANVSNAGFDLDALASRHPALPDTVGHAEGHVFDAVTGIPLPGAIVASGDSAVTADQFGHYRLDLPGGEHLVSAASDGYRNESDTLDLPAGYIVNNDFYLYSNLWLNNRKAPAIARLKVSPNPFSDEVTVCFTLAVPSVATFRLAGMNGSLMASTAAKAFPAGENSFTWKIASSGHQYLSPGSCMLIVEIPGSRETVTLIRTF
jgi:hypothetical protein